MLWKLWLKLAAAQVYSHYLGDIRQTLPCGCREESGGVMALENLGIKRSAVTNYVFRLLTRSRTTLEQLPGDSFVRMLPQLRNIRFTGLVLVEMPGGMLGRLLYQNGRMVFASQGDLEAQDALRVIQRSVGGSTFIIFSLDPAQSALALSAVDGIPHGVGMQIPVGGDVLFAEQRKRGFSGILALEAGSSLLIWQFTGGHLQFGPDVPQDLERYRLIHIAWNPHELPELFLDTSETASLGNLTAQPAQAQPVYPQNNQPVFGAPQQPFAQQPQQYYQPAAPQFPQQQFAQAQPAPQFSGGTDINTEIWRTFQDVLKKHLADRAPRVFNLMRQEHTLETGATLVNSLARQLERVAGAAVAQAFRARFGL